MYVYSWNHHSLSAIRHHPVVQYGLVSDHGRARCSIGGRVREGLLEPPLSTSCWVWEWPVQNWRLHSDLAEGAEQGSFLALAKMEGPGKEKTRVPQSATEAVGMSLPFLKHCGTNETKYQWRLAPGCWSCSCPNGTDIHHYRTGGPLPVLPSYINS